METKLPFTWQDIVFEEYYRVINGDNETYTNDRNTSEIVITSIDPLSLVIVKHIIKLSEILYLYLL